MFNTCILIPMNRNSQDSSDANVCPFMVLYASICMFNNMAHI